VTGLSKNKSKEGGCMLSAGDRVRLSSALCRASQNIRIHPSSYGRFPAVLPIGSVGEVVDLDAKEAFYRFMLRKPEKWEQDFLADNTVYVTIGRQFTWYVEKI
jgi:hypothetical protein